METSQPRSKIVLSTKRHVDAIAKQQYDLSRSLANKRSFFLDFLAQRAIDCCSVRH